MSAEVKRESQSCPSESNENQIPPSLTKQRLLEMLREKQEEWRRDTAPDRKTMGFTIDKVEVF